MKVKISMALCMCLFALSLFSFSLVKYEGGFFTINKPKNWQIYTAGQCSDFAFLIRDPSNPTRQIFYFGEVGPLYLLEEQKQLDYNYMSMGGYQSPWFEMPVINPFTPDNFLKNFYLIANTEIARSFMPECPELRNFKIVSVAPQINPIGSGTTELIRALFTDGGNVGEGLFYVTLVPLLPYTGSPGGGIGAAFLFMGITAPKNEFRENYETLARSLGSFKMDENYISNCIRQQQETYSGILEAGKTLNETSDIIMESWENRNRTDDILSEKWSDAILGRERLFDPETGNVYEVETGFYDKYKSNMDLYEMKKLEPLPDDDYELWMRNPFEGEKYIR